MGVAEHTELTKRRRTVHGNPWLTLLAMKPTNFDHFILRLAGGALQHSNPEERKALVMCARAQQPIFILDRPPSSSLEKLAIAPLRKFLLRINALYHRDGGAERVIEHINVLLTSPHLCGIAINLLYSYPVSSEYIRDTRLSSFQTEFDVAQSTRRAPAINWRPFFQGRHSEILNDVIGSARPDLSIRIYQHMQAFRSRFMHATLFPSISSRGVSRSTQDDFRDNLAQTSTTVDPFSDITPRQLLQLYLRDGVRTSGASEMRQKWYPTGLKPRTYFAQGGDCYFASMYLKDFFNQLADSFVFTNRFSRVAPGRLSIQHPDGSFVVYDYSSFTSNFSEQIYFLEELADFFREVPVTLWGPNLGRSFVTIGSLIDEYIAVCNDNPEFRSGATLPVSFEGMATHIQAGFLGVYGNLMTCTIPHGLVARYVSVSDQTTLTAGDDGVIEPVTTRQESIHALQLLGDLNPEKMFDSKDPSVLLKLPFQAIYGNTVAGFRAEFPNLNFVIARNEEMDERFSHLSDMKHGDRRFLIYRQVVRCIRSLTRFELKDWEAGVIHSFLDTVITIMSLRDGGEKDQLTMRLSTGKVVAVPPLPHYWYTQLCHGGFTTFFPFSADDFIRVRRRGIEESNVDELVAGSIVITRKTRPLTFLQDSGYVRFVEHDSLGEEDDDYQWLRRSEVEEYRALGPELYRCIVLEDVSPWVMRELYRKPGSGYIEPVLLEIGDELSTEGHRKRVKTAFSSSRYVDLDAPVGVEVVLDYGGPVSVDEGLGSVPVHDFYHVMYL